MANGPLNLVVHQLRRTALLRETAEATDGQLMACYAARRDEVAFEALVRRHGPMVWGVCRRVLTNPQDREDAFQATFLVLVRKAAAVRPREAVAGGLYGVAYRAALKARATAARRAARERQVRQMPEPAAAGEGPWHDWLPLLDQELARLPTKYRLPLVLCELEGKTRKEAAGQLGWPAGTVAGRLAQGRAMLAKRLRRHGLPFSGGLLAAVFAQHTAAAGVPTSLLVSTVQAAAAFAAGKAAAGVVSVRAAALTEGMVKAMLLSKIKILAGFMLVMAIVAGGAGVLTRGAWAMNATAVKSNGGPHGRGKPPDEGTGDGAKGVLHDKRLREEAVLIARLLDSANAEWAGRMQDFADGKGDPERLYASARRLLQAQLEKAKTKDARIAAWEAHLGRMSVVEEINRKRFEAGKLKASDLQASRFWRLEGKIGLARAKRQ